jgi:hypothetical protein
MLKFLFHISEKPADARLLSSVQNWTAPVILMRPFFPVKTPSLPVTDHTGGEVLARVRHAK